MSECVFCDDTGHVCENHTNKPWGGISNNKNACNCGGAGMPCFVCCVDIPQNGTHSITEAFITKNQKMGNRNE